MLRIIKANDPITVSTLTLMLVGEPGVGKTSTGFTADKPLLLDFDSGAYRSRNRRDSVNVGEWSEIAVFTDADFAPYSTIVVDTAGRCLDCITAHLVKTQPKLSKASGVLTLQGFGELKSTFVNWIKRLRALGKDVVLLAHDSEEKNGDEVRIRPDVQGGSRNELIKAADMIGFLYQSGSGRILDFSPTDKWIGKNPASLPPLAVPDFAKVPDFLAKAITDSKAALNALSAAALAQQSILDEWAGLVAQIHTPADADGALRVIESRDLMDQTKTVKGLLLTRTRALNFEFDAKAKAFKALPVADVPAAA